MEVMGETESLCVAYEKRYSSLCGPDSDFCAQLGTMAQFFQGRADLSVRQHVTSVIEGLGKEMKEATWRSLQKHVEHLQGGGPEDGEEGSSQESKYFLRLKK